MRKNYMMNVYDVMEALHVSKSYAYGVIREQNKELKEKGFQTLSGKIPRPFFEKKFYGYQSNADSA